jgi:hypothetical protein
VSASKYCTHYHQQKLLKQLNYQQHCYPENNIYTEDASFWRRIMILWWNVLEVEQKNVKLFNWEPEIITRTTLLYWSARVRTTATTAAWVCAVRQLFWNSTNVFSRIQRPTRIEQPSNRMTKMTALSSLHD